MFKFMKAVVVAGLVALVAACGSFKTTVQSEEGTFLQLVGNPQDVVLVLDQSTTMDLNQAKSFDLDGRNITKIVIPPGQHRVTLTRGGNLLVDRKIFVSEGNAFEINIP